MNNQSKAVKRAGEVACSLISEGYLHVSSRYCEAEQSMFCKLRHWCNGNIFVLIARENQFVAAKNGVVKIKETF